jgi:hypothetical protein
MTEAEEASGLDQTGVPVAEQANAITNIRRRELVLPSAKFMLLHTEPSELNYCMLLALGNGLEGQLLLRRSLLSSWASRAIESIAPSRLLLTMSACRI